jgi:MFS family permease
MRKRVFYGWYIVAGSVAMNFYLSVVFFQGFQVFFLPILNEFGWTRALTSGAFSLRQLESGLLAPVIGFLVDRWGPRVIILLGVIVGGAGMVGMAYINSVWSFYVVFMVASLGVSGASHGVSWSVAVANWFNRLRGRALGIAMLGPVVGGPFVVSVAVLEGWLGWRVSMLLLGVGVWIVGIPLSLLARSFPEKYGYLPDGDTRGGANDDDYEDENFEGIGVKEAVRTRNFWVITVLFGAQFIGISGLFVHLIPMLQDLNYSASQAAGILGLLFLLSGIGRIGAGTLADMIDYRLVMSVLIVFQLVALMLLTLVSGPSDFWLVVLYSFLFGIGFGGAIPLRPFLIMQIFGSRSFGALQGLVQGGAIGAGMAGPVFYGWIFDTRESYNIAIYATIAITTLALPLLYLLPRSRLVGKWSTAAVVH